MNTITIDRAKHDQADAIAILVGDLLQEIMDRIGIDVFHFDLEETQERLRDFIESEKNFVFIAIDELSKQIIGFASSYEGYALYAEGALGTMAELYVQPSYR